jgi:tyrosine-protein phosphatase SIW14
MISRTVALPRQSLALKAFFLFVLCALASAPAALAQAKREQVAGVKNFGRVTPKYFRGGSVTAEGVENLHRMGVRTIIDLRDKPSPDEPEACERLKIKYYKFATDGHATPDRATFDTILSIIKNAKDPVYVHCSAGKHRAGTVCALYRMEVQGWSPEQAWAEQQSYGFGVPEEHPELYAFAYGKRAAATDSSDVTYVSARTVVPSSAARSFLSDDEGRDAKKADSKKSKKDDDDEADDDDDDNKKDDDDEGDDEEKSEKKSDKHKSKSDKSSDKKLRSEVADEPHPIRKATEAEPEAEPTEEVATPSAKPTVAALSADAAYIPMEKALERARAEGGSGDLLKVDLEYDPLRSITTWDFTFSSGTEYEIDASSGNVIASKQKAPAKLAVLAPIGIDKSAAAFKTFQQIIAAAEKENGGNVTEMELKKIKGRDSVVFEVVFNDGSTVYYDAQSGDKATF